ncbi:Gp138 family membrane-puncturing spike protein [Dethiothermospora halolimnae]|uniref:Gp138 family membrane-puncturing spike protein n=1 Tax=Dethiothermospora halolimnae TaxID=3114390 RepID=UPI003CCBE000
MSNAINFLDEMMEERLSDVHTCMLAKIEEYDPVTMKAKVQPLFKRKYKNQDPKELQPISEVPVMHLKAGNFIIRPPYQKNDVVLLVFGERAIDNTMLTGDKEDPQHTRKHSISDAIVIGGIMPFNKTLPSEHGEDLLISKSDLSSKVVIKKNNDIIIHTDGKVKLGDEGAFEGVPKGLTLKEWLDNHTHPISWTDPAGSGTSGKPSPSPNPSEKVKTV